jgi:hypothetical protein
MKVAIVCALILSAATAVAETVIIEYPDHYYVESTDVPSVKPAPSRERNVPPVAATPVVKSEVIPTSSSSRPITSPELKTRPLDPAERRVAMEREIQRLQRERSELMTPRPGETPEQADRRQRDAHGRLRKINKLSSEVLNIPVQGNEQGR